MENEYRRGYDLPLTTEKWRAWLVLPVVVLAVVYLEMRMDRHSFPDQAVLFMRVLYTVLLVPYGLAELARGFAKLHIIPEGIAVTLFGKTLRQIPRHEIRLLAGVMYTRKSNTYKWIAVCPCSLEKLAERMDRKGSMKEHLKGQWTERMAHKYLHRLGSSLRRDLGLPTKDIFLIEWSPQRLALLQKMYPGIPWMDLTEKKVLDAELDP